MQEEKDIKVAQLRGKKEIAEASDAEALAFLQWKEKNLLESYRQLAVNLADDILSDNALYGLSRFWSYAEDEEEIRQLMCFSAVLAVRQKVENSLLAEYIVNAFLEEIKSRVPQAYERLSKSGEYNLYLLASRCRREPELEIGKTFAFLCRREHTAIYVEYGETLYSCTFSTVSEKVKQTTQRNL